MMNQATFNFTLGRAKEAVQYHNKSLDIRRLLYGFHPSIGGCYNNLSEAYETMGDYQTASKHAITGLKIKRHFFKGPSHAVIDSLITVARLTTRKTGR